MCVWNILHLLSASIGRYLRTVLEHQLADCERRSQNLGRVLEYAVSQVGIYNRVRIMFDFSWKIIYIFMHNNVG